MTMNKGYISGMIVSDRCLVHLIISRELLPITRSFGLNIDLDILARHMILTKYYRKIAYLMH